MQNLLAAEKTLSNSMLDGVVLLRQSQKSCGFTPLVPSNSKKFISFVTIFSRL